MLDRPAKYDEREINRKAVRLSANLQRLLLTDGPPDGLLSLNPNFAPARSEPPIRAGSPQLLVKFAAQLDMFEWTAVDWRMANVGTGRAARIWST